MVKRQLTLRLHDEIIIDGFAGGGGASLGIEWALGRSPDDAFNHDPEALAMHRENHPNTRHHCGNIWDYDPATVVGTRYQGGEVRPGGYALGLEQPMNTITSEPRFGLVTVAGEAYEIADIGMRMLAPRELYRAQGFPDSYVIDPVVDGERLSKTAQVRMVGNSVSPVLARALVAANVAAMEVAA